mgnify:CR=1 FL=1
MGRYLPIARPMPLFAPVTAATRDSMAILLRQWWWLVGWETFCRREMWVLVCYLMLSFVWGCPRSDDCMDIGVWRHGIWGGCEELSATPIHLVIVRYTYI